MNQFTQGLVEKPWHLRIFGFGVTLAVCSFANFVEIPSIKALTLIAYGSIIFSYFGMTIGEKVWKESWKGFLPFVTALSLGAGIGLWGFFPPNQTPSNFTYAFVEAAVCTIAVFLGSTFNNGPGPYDDYAGMR